MAEQSERNEEPGSGGQPRRRGGETFKREGPVPPANDTGRNVEEMNERARESVIRNVTPDEQVD